MFSIISFTSQKSNIDNRYQTVAIFSGWVTFSKPSFWLSMLVFTYFLFFSGYLVLTEAALRDGHPMGGDVGGDSFNVPIE